MAKYSRPNSQSKYLFVPRNILPFFPFFFPFFFSNVPKNKRSPATGIHILQVHPPTQHNPTPRQNQALISMHPVIIIIRTIISIDNHRHLILLITDVIRLFADRETNARPSWKPAVGTRYSLSESEDGVVGWIAVEG
jgi:hypothetical protein